MQTKQILVFFCAIAAMAVTSCSTTKSASNDHGHSQNIHWGYETEDGPERWSSMDSEWLLCAEGLEQSPVDLANATLLSLVEINVHTPSGNEVEVLNQKGVIKALDNGHTIQINAKSGEMITVGDRTYELVQFHFHAPSEHTIKGEHFPMEMHFVHKAKDGALAVVGVFIVEGAENPGIAPIWDQLPNMAGIETTVQVPTDFADHIFPGKATGIYHYSGSLTTPPCSEGVEWYIRRKPIQLSKEQIEAFKAHYDHNNRPVQALNERTLYLEEQPRVTIDSQIK